MAQAQTTHATTEAHGGTHEEVGFPPFMTETFGGQLLWLAITFVVLYTLLSRLVLPRLGGIIENRRAMISNDLDDAAAMKSRAEEAGAAYEKALAEAKGRAQALAQETRAKLSAESDTTRKALEADLNQRLADAEATITSKKAEAMSHVDAIARDTASAIIERLTGKAPAPQKVEAALNQIKA
ncbi:F0F1 ATP synthase subunit B' [Microvirga sp. 3-52]|uniref:F0F1 ATP synthase subunit B family protein n=1 Tax=Microvirga sp. 3-52 TaxID=2792425 RepID=UPI001AC5A36B|nr:F0F1 ATP synthase subunit B' [Microvirga sp. 3-52]MBO1904509.1 F0F1 ATP synthase subunit B' [Microvirga sp. 3-52]MBS7451948.1 F0F1 ATP synthase subunit B' [Microvirga sp. 3-52]